MRRIATYLLALTLLGSFPVAGSAAGQTEGAATCVERVQPLRACASASNDLEHYRNHSTDVDADEVGTAECPGRTDGVGLTTGTGRLSACAQTVDRDGEGTADAAADPCNERAGYRQAGASATAAGREAGACAYTGYKPGHLGPIPLPPNVQADAGLCNGIGVSLMFTVHGVGFDSCLSLS